jgi:KipI family sensor histidine kinase inhibitor
MGTSRRPLSPSIIPFGDAAVLVELGYEVGTDANQRTLALADAVRRLSVGEPGYGSPVPGLGTVLVPIDPEQLTTEAAIARLTALVGRGRTTRPSTGDTATGVIELPTRYGGADGPDLDEVAEETGLSPAEVVDLHAASEYRVLFLGFAPGFAYLGDLPSALDVPRLATPRRRVPAGSVAIAGRQTAVYPFETPGGWRLIGCTDIRVWDVTAPAPALLLPGSRVRFVPAEAPT